MAADRFFLNFVLFKSAPMEKPRTGDATGPLRFQGGNQ
jgi:hypothetical protein